MAYIKIRQEKVDKKTVEELKEICPFDAFDYIDAYLSINAACKMCKLCVQKGPEGVCELIEGTPASIDKGAYRGIAVFIETRNDTIHPVGWELIGKARELVADTTNPVHALIIGPSTARAAELALAYGVDKVTAYEHEDYRYHDLERITDIVADFCKRTRLNVLLIGGTPYGRSLAPRIAARLKTGLTADCTKLEMTDEGDLVQIRPAFGGNIMARIVTPAHRPQLATIRHKMFNAPAPATPFGVIDRLSEAAGKQRDRVRLVSTRVRPQVDDIADAETIIALGRAFKKKKDLALVEPLRKALSAELACTRPLIENGWFDARRQIGLSGRTVKPKLLVNIGISGAVQYIEGIRDAECILTVNTDPECALASISHHTIVGDLYDVLPTLNDHLKKNGRVPS